MIIKVYEKMLLTFVPIFIFTAFIYMLDISIEPAQAGTVIPGGSITSDTTWTLAESPYWVQNDVTVEVGVTLTIEPGVWVKVRNATPMEARIHFYIKGNLIAKGTSSQMIHFTSNESTPAPKDWGNIWINSTATAVLDYCNISYGNDVVALFYASNIMVTNCTIVYNMVGVDFIFATRNTITGNLISQNEICNIYLQNSDDNTITNNNITLSVQYGLYSQNSMVNNIYHNNFIDNWIPQASDDSNGNFWNDIYPSGGNYWSDWSPITPDLYDGATTPQTTGSPDGICDNPYYIDGDSVDYYPLKYPFGTPRPDNEPPVINDVNVTPNPQNVHDSVNISAIVGDNEQVDDVWINITDPFGETVGNFSMYYNITNERYYHDVIFDILGNYQFTIWANDTSNNWNFSSSSFIIKDLIPPSIGNVAPEPSVQEIFGNVNISAMVIDNYDLYGVWVNISRPDGSSINTTMNLTNGNPYYLNQSYNQIGIYDFIIWANDTSNNWNFTIGSFMIGDFTIPTITNVVTNPNIQDVFGSINISASVQDNYDLYGVWVNISRSDGSSANITMDQITGDVFFLYQNYSQIGVYSFTIWANDTYNNWNFTLGSFIIGDFSTPSISDVISDPEIQDIFDNVNISAKITDNFELYGAWVNITHPDGSSTNVTMDKAIGDLFYLNQSYGQAGIYYFTIWANDTSNNWISETDSFQILDAEEPHSSVKIFPLYWKNILQFAVEWTASDDTGLSNITLLYRYSADNSSWSPWVEYTFNNTISGTSATGSFQFTASAEGYYEFFVNASDTDNNWEPDASSAEAITAVDTSPPSSYINSISTYWMNSSPQTLDAFAIDVPSGVKDVTLWYRYSVNNVFWGLWKVFDTDQIEPWTWEFDFPYGEGYYEFYSTARDNADNVESKTLRETLCAYDITPPIAYAGEDQEGEPGTTIYFDGSGSTDNFGIISNYTWTIIKDFAVISTLYGINPTFNFDVIGEYTVTLTVKDSSGNIDNDMMMVFIIPKFVDEESPEIIHAAIPTNQEVHFAVNITAEVSDNVEVFGVWVQIFNPKNGELGNVSMMRVGLSNDYWYENIYSVVGIFNYSIWANDTSDNRALAYGSFVIQDTTPPTAVAGEDLTINISETAYFDGSGSTDNIEIINYTWNISKDGNLILTLYGIYPKYEFDNTGIYNVTLTVRDAVGNIDNDVITLTVESPKIPSQTDYFWIIFLIILIIVIIAFYFLFRLRKKETSEEELETQTLPTEHFKSQPSPKEDMPLPTQEEEPLEPGEGEDEL